MGENTSSPNCTHVDMDRVYGHGQRCGVCGCLSSIGFLYQCRQDSKANSFGSVASQGMTKPEPAKSKLRKELERSGLSESIIRGAESGHYTDQQLQKLKQLKRELQDTIIDVQQAEQANDAIARLMDMSMTTGSTEDASGSSLAANSSLARCSFQACHACRPHYLDRLYISFQTAVTAGLPPMTHADLAMLPVKSAAIIRSIDTKGQPVSTKKTLNSPTTLTRRQQSASANNTTSTERTFKITQSDINQAFPHTASHKPSHHSSLRRTQGFKTAVQGIFRYTRDPSAPHQAPSTHRTTTHGTAIPSTPTDTPALRRARLAKERQQRLLANQVPVHGFARVPVAADISAFTVQSRDRGARTDSGILMESLDAGRAGAMARGQAGAGLGVREKREGGLQGVMAQV